MNVKPIIQLVSCALVCQFAAGDILVLKGQPDPIFGIVDSIDERKVTFSVYRQSDQVFGKREFPRQDVESVIRTIDPARLEKLSIERLEDYRDYAEELSGFRNDPAARQLSIRLILICMYHAGTTKKDTELCVSAAFNLKQLAHSDQEQQRFDVIAGIYGANSSATRPDEVPADQPREDFSTFHSLVRALRTERFDEAASYLESLTERDWLDAWSITQDEVSTALLDRRIGEELLLKLITTELAIRGDTPESSTNLDDRSTNYSRSSSKMPRQIGWIPELADLTEFDLEKTRFRDGKWMRPPNKNSPE